MTTPVRIRLSRAKGFNLQEASQALNGLPAVNCARGPGRKLGNPFIVGKDGDARECVFLFENMLFGFYALRKTPSVKEQRRARRIILAALEELRGKNVGCWCRAGRPCHTDIYLRFANR